MKCMAVFSIVILYFTIIISDDPLDNFHPVAMITFIWFCSGNPTFVFGKWIFSAGVGQRNNCKSRSFPL